MKNVSRRKFLGAAIGTGIAGSASLAGMPIIQGGLKEYFPIDDFEKKNTTSTENPPEFVAYDVIPAFFHWRFGSEYRGNIQSAKSADFDLWLTPTIERKNYGFREEVFNKCKEIDRKRNGKPVALCYSGGESSEVIAIALKQLGIPFELYYLDVWFSDVNRKAYAEPFAKSIGAPLRVVGVSEHSFITQILYKNTLDYGSDNPDFSLMTHLFNAIPESHFIVTGSGHLERSGTRFERIGNQAKPPEGADRYYRPFSLNHILYYTWAIQNNRVGEFYFYQSSASLMASVFENPIVQSNYPFYNHKALLYSEFPEIKPRAKTTNWQGDAGPSVAAFARTKIQKFCDANGLGHWRPNVGCAVNLAAVFTS